MNIWVWDNLLQLLSELGNTLQRRADRLWRRSEEWNGGNPVQSLEKRVLNVSGIHQRVGQEPAVR